MSWEEDFLIAAAIFGDEEERANKGKSKKSKKNTSKSKKSPKIAQSSFKKAPVKQSSPKKTKSKSSFDLFGLSGMYETAVAIENLKKLNDQLGSSSSGSKNEHKKTQEAKTEPTSSALPQDIPFGVSDEKEIAAKKGLEELGYSTSNWSEYIDNLQDLFSNDNTDIDDDDYDDEDEDEDDVEESIDDYEEEEELMEKRRKIVASLISNTEIIKDQFDRIGLTISSFGFDIDDDYWLTAFIEVKALKELKLDSMYSVGMNLYDESGHLLYSEDDKIYPDDFNGFQTMTINFRRDKIATNVKSTKIFITKR